MSVWRKVEKSERDKEFWHEALRKGQITQAEHDHVCKPFFVEEAGLEELSPEGFAEKFQQVVQPRNLVLREPEEEERKYTRAELEMLQDSYT